MGGLLFRSSATELQLPAVLRDASVSEHEARSSGPLRVLGCPRCQRRLCTLAREGEDTTAVWKAPANRVEKALFGGASHFKCRMCGQGRVAVEVLGDAPKSSDGEEGTDDRLPLRVSLKGTTGRNDFRPFCVAVCGMYESVVARGAALLQAETVTKTRQVNVTQHTFKRSELAKLSEDALPKPPMELLVIVHKISGQRNPITDQHGLYNNLLKHAWSRADVVLLMLFDVPPGYFAQLISEQPTLRGLLCAGRLLPLFSSEDSSSEGDMDAEATEAAIKASEAAKAANPEARPPEEAEAAWWLVRCLDGRVPRHEGLPADNGKSAEVTAKLASVVAEGKGEEKAEPRKHSPEEAAGGTVAASCTIAVLAQVAQDFEGQASVRD